jgi:hypothetical protein
MYIYSYIYKDFRSEIEWGELYIYIYSVFKLCPSWAWCVTRIDVVGANGCKCVVLGQNWVFKIFGSSV